MKTTLRLAVVILLAGGSVAEAQRVEDGIIVLYKFDEGDDTVVGDSGPGEPLDLEIDPNDLDNLVVWLDDGGLAMNLNTGPQGTGGAFPIQSAGPATGIQALHLAIAAVTLNRATRCVQGCAGIPRISSPSTCCGTVGRALDCVRADDPILTVQEAQLRSDRRLFLARPRPTAPRDGVW